MNKKTADQKKSENFSMRLTRSEKRDLEMLKKRLGKNNKSDAIKHALAFTLQSLEQPRLQAAA